MDKLAVIQNQLQLAKEELRDENCDNQLVFDYVEYAKILTDQLIKQVN